MIWLELSARNQWFLALGNTIEKATKFRYTVLNHLMMPQNVCSWKRAKWCGRGFSWHFFQRIMTEHPWFLQYRTNTDGELPFSTASSSDESRLRSSASDPNCIILADLDNIEATATALWLLLVWWYDGFVSILQDLTSMVVRTCFSNNNHDLALEMLGWSVILIRVKSRPFYVQV